MLGMPIVLNQPTQLNPNSEYSTTSVLRAGSEVKKISVVGTASAKHAKLITAASVSDTLFSLHTSFATANMTNVLVIIAAFSVRDSASHRCACPLSVGVRR